MKALPTSWHLSPYCCAHLACAGALLLCANLAAATDQTEAALHSLKTAPCRSGTKSCRAPVAIATPATAPPIKLAPGDPPPATPTVRLDLPRLRAAVIDPRDLPDVQFENNYGFAERIKDLRALPVMTLWQSPRTQVYLGVDRKGLAGLHIRQRCDCGDQSHLWHSSADSSRNSATNDPPPALRSVSP